MHDDRETSDLGDASEEPTDGGVLDEHDDAVLAADDTGMLAGERLITVTGDRGGPGRQRTATPVTARGAHQRWSD